MDSQQQTVDLAFKLFDSMQGGTYQLLGALCQNLRWASEVDSGARALMRYADKGGELESTFCSEEYLGVMTARMRDEGIDYASGLVPLGKDGKFVGIISTADVDRERVQQIIDRVREEIEPGGVKPKRMIENLSLGKARVIEGLGIPEAMLFAKYAEASKVCIAVDETDRNTRSLVYPSQYADTMQEMKHHVAMAFAGPGGHALERQFMYDHENFKRVSERVLNFDKSRDEFYVMGSAGPRLFVGERDVRIFDQDGMERQSISRSEAGSERVIRQALDRISHPVDLTAKEYAQAAGLSYKERLNVLKDIDGAHGRPGFSDKESRDLARRLGESRKALEEVMRRKENLYEQKLALENPEQSVYQYSYLDDAMSMPDFEALENMNKESIREDSRERQEEAERRYGTYCDHEEMLGLREQGLQQCVLEGREPGGMDNRDMEDALELEEREV